MIEPYDDEMPAEISDRQRAIVEAGNLIDALADECPDAQHIKDVWYQVGLRVRGAIAELRLIEQPRGFQKLHSEREIKNDNGFLVASK